MKKVKIEVIRITQYVDLIEKYENKIEMPCMLKVGNVFYAEEIDVIPEGLCETAYETLKPFINDLLNGKGHFYGDWMKNPYSAMVSCNDGFRPVTFHLELIDN